jgi:hypothetical protein
MARSDRNAQQIDQPRLDQFGSLLLFDHGEILHFEYLRFEITILPLEKSSGSTQISSMMFLKGRFYGATGQS